MKKCHFLLALITFIVAATPRTFAQTEAGWQTDADGTRFIYVNEANFPDEAFRNILLTDEHNALNYPDYCNLNGYGKDGKLTADELSSVTIISVVKSNIADLTGIAYFTALTVLHCENNSLTALDVSSNSKLSELSCQENQLATLNVTGCSPLKSLRCEENNLTALDVTKNTLLSKLYCSTNKLLELDVTKNTALTYFNCGFNQLTALDVSKNTKLIELSCHSNQLATLELTNNTKLKTLSCNNNNLTSLDVSVCPDLTWLTCSSNPLESIDVTRNLKLTNFYCQDTKITTLDVTRNTELNTLMCHGNSLTEIDVTQNTKLTTLSCNNCLLKALDVTKNTELTSLNCGKNLLTELDLSNMKGSSGTLGTQVPQIDVVVIDREKIAIPCNTNNGNLSSYGKFPAETIGGQNYIIYQDGGNADVDLYQKKVNYYYATGAPMTGVKSMGVNVTTSPYVMYVNPKAKKNGERWYGTLYLSYASKVPEGAECYYASEITADEELVMTKLDRSKAIPANTGIYVEAIDGAGFYAFYEAEEGLAENTVVGNVLTGHLVNKRVGYKEVLTLGHENGTGELGFWNFTGTTIPAHRAYVPASALASASGAKGLRLRFSDETNNIQTIDRQTAAENGTEAVYSLSGQRVADDQGLPRGIYIKQGRKFIVR